MNLDLTHATLDVMGTLVEWLLTPVILVLLALVAARRGDRLAARARRAIDRADLLARIGPMLGLMGTLIPLGPGLAALGNGQLDALAQAVTVAFNTTVMGLLIGILGFLLGRLRRRWYDAAMAQLEAAP